MLYWPNSSSSKALDLLRQGRPFLQLQLRRNILPHPLPVGSTLYMRHRLLGPYSIKVPRTTPEELVVLAIAALKAISHARRCIRNRQTALLRINGKVVEQFCHEPKYPRLVGGGVGAASGPDARFPYTGIDEARVQAVGDDVAVFRHSRHAYLEFGEPDLQVEFVGGVVSCVEVVRVEVGEVV